MSVSVPKHLNIQYKNYKGTCNQLEPVLVINLLVSNLSKGNCLNECQNFNIYRSVSFLQRKLEPVIPNLISFLQASLYGFNFNCLLLCS